MCKLPKSDGSVQQNVRPCVIVSNDIGNTFSTVIEVVALTTRQKPSLPTHCDISEKSGTKIIDSIALCEYPIPVPVKYFLEYLGKCSEREIANLKDCLKISLGL